MIYQEINIIKESRGNPIMVTTVIKRNGERVPYERNKIFKAINAANKECNYPMKDDDINTIIDNIESFLSNRIYTSVEELQDLVEKNIIDKGFSSVGIAYIKYRDKHQYRREISDKLLSSFNDLLFIDSSESDLKRDNANIDGNAPMGIMLKVGTEATKCWGLNYDMPTKFANAHKENWIHIHDLDFSYITMNCLQIDLPKVLHNGFTIGNGYIREPNSIRSYAALECIVIQSSQNDFLGGQSINAHGTAMAEGIRKTFITGIEDALYYHCIYNDLLDDGNDNLFKHKLKGDPNIRYSETDNDYVYTNTIEEVKNRFKAITNQDINDHDVVNVYKIAKKYTEKETYQAMEAVIHNLNTMHSRAGSQCPFSSLNYGMDTTPEGRLAIKATLKAIWDGLGNGETPIFPISVFQLRSGVNYNPGDPNYDLFKLAMKVSAKRLFPNFTNLDSSFNSPYYKEGVYNSYVATMG